MIVLCHVLSFYKQAISISEDESKGHGGANGNDQKIPPSIHTTPTLSQVHCKITTLLLAHYLVE